MKAELEVWALALAAYERRRNLTSLELFSVSSSTHTLSLHFQDINMEPPGWKTVRELASR